MGVGGAGGGGGLFHPVGERWKSPRSVCKSMNTLGPTTTNRQESNKKGEQEKN